MADVIYPQFLTRLKKEAGRVIEALPAPDEWDEIVVIGYLKNGEDYIATNIADGPDMLWLLEMAKKKLLDTADALDSG
jgi:hypothetical protein